MLNCGYFVKRHHYCQVELSLHLYYFLLVIVSLACGSLPPTEVEWSAAILASVGMISGWVLLSHVAARTVAIHVAGEKLPAIAGAQWFEKQMAAFRWLGLGVSVFCLAGFGIARGIETLPVIGDSMLLQAMVLLAPGIVITVGTWSAEHMYGIRLGYTDPGLFGYIAAISQSFRSGMSWLVLPVLVLLAASDGIAWLPISDEAGVWVSLAGIALFVPLVLPLLIRYLFKTAPMNLNQQTWISDLMRAAGAGRTRVVRWDTESIQFNAMVAGFVPPFRTLFLSDRLLDELPTPQIAMVVLHEAAHLKRRHVPIRILAVLPAWIAGTLVTQFVDQFTGHPQWAMAIGSGVGILMTLGILRMISYRTEYDADVTACRMAERLAPQFDQLPDDFSSASNALSSALIRVTFDHPSARKATWLHPSVADRIACMRRNGEDLGIQAR
jgi:Zn-dependent protease with chaperone function